MRRAGGLLLVVSVLAACGSQTQEVRPLISQTEGNSVVSAWDPDSVKAALDRIATEVTRQGAAEGSWADVDRDLLNEEILETVLVEPDRPPVEYMGGTAAASVDVSSERILVSMSGENGACWGIRLSGEVSNPVVERAAVFSPSCEATQLRRAAVTWKTGWPSKAPLPASGQATTGPGPEQGPAPVTPGASDSLGQPAPGGSTPASASPQPSGQ